MPLTSNDVLDKLESFRVAYNDVDLGALESLLSPDVSWGHKNRFKGEGRDALIASIQDFARRMPGRSFEKPSRFAVNGNLAFVEQTWHGTPTKSDASWGWEEGVPVTMGTCSLFVLSDDGRIQEWSDHG